MVRSVSVQGSGDGTLHCDTHQTPRRYQSLMVSLSSETSRGPAESSRVQRDGTATGVHVIHAGQRRFSHHRATRSAGVYRPKHRAVPCERSGLATIPPECQTDDSPFRVPDRPPGQSTLPPECQTGLQDIRPSLQSARLTSRTFDPPSRAPDRSPGHSTLPSRPASGGAWSGRRHLQPGS